MQSRNDNIVYGSFEVLDCDNRFLFYTNQKKINWYLKRNLAEIVSHDPLIIKLLFHNKGIGQRGDNYHSQVLLNRCVVCNSTNV